MKPGPDALVPHMDDMLMEMRAVQNPSAQLTEAIEKIVEARAEFAKHTADPSKWLPEEEEESEDDTEDDTEETDED